MPPAPTLAAGRSADPLVRALAFLDATQRTGCDAGEASPDAGDWPQTVDIDRTPFAGVRVREMSPFASAAVHLALTRLTPRNAAAAGLPFQAVERAVRIRRRVEAFLRRFDVARPDVPTGSFGFWPERAACGRPLAAIERLVLRTMLVGPRPCGPLSPRYGPSCPFEFGIWPDLDTTAFVELALGPDAVVDDVRRAPSDAPYLWARDLDPGRPLRRGGHAGPTGAYAVWLQPAGAPMRNELDVVVGAHALLALARTGRASLAGFDETARFIDRTIAAGLHHPTRAVTDYYPEGFTLHAEVARAWADGPVPALGATVRRLADEVEAQACVGDDGTVTWPGEDDPYPTSLALCTLLFAGRRGPLVQGGVRHLLAREDARTGGWPEAVICEGRAESGIRMRWRSRAVPTAAAIEALLLARAPRRTGSRRRGRPPRRRHTPFIPRQAAPLRAR